MPIADSNEEKKAIGLANALNLLLFSKGITSSSVGSLLYSSAVNTFANLELDITPTRYLSNENGKNPSWQQIDLSLGVKNILPVISGGTGRNSFTYHGVLIGNKENKISTTTSGYPGQLLQSNGDVNDPDWTETSYPSETLKGDILYASDVDMLATLCFSSLQTRYLANTGEGGTLPQWDAINLKDGVKEVLSVKHGGTGSEFFSHNCLLVGQGQNKIENIETGRTGQILVGRSDSTPSFSSLLNGNFTFYGKEERSLSITSDLKSTLEIKQKDKSFNLSVAGNGLDYLYNNQIIAQLSSEGTLTLPFHPCFCISENEYFDQSNDYDERNKRFMFSVSGKYFINSKLVHKDVGDVLKIKENTFIFLV